MLAEVLLAGGVALLLRHLYWVCRVCWLTRHMPGPRAYPIIGNYLDMAGSQEGLYDRILQVARRYSCTFKCWMGPCLVVVPTRSEDMQAAMTSPHLTTKPGLCYDVADPLLGRGLVTLWGGEAYRQHRKAILPSFHMDRMQEFLSSINRNAKLVVIELGAFPAGGVVDMTVLAGRCASRSACENFLFVDPSLLDKERDGYVRMAHQSAGAVSFRALRPWFLLPGLFSLLSPDMHAEFEQSAACIEDFVTKVLRIKEEQAQALGVKHTPHKSDWLLEHLASGTGLTRQELEDEVRTILFTSVMTSTDFLSFFTMVMSVQLDVQRKVQKEVEEVLGGDLERDVEAVDLSRLQYTECVVKEVLRLFPVVSMFGRQALRDVTLPSGAVVPEGAFVGLFPVRLHEDERWFPQPSEFRPERFLPENSQGRPHHAFVPFSGGKRICMGQRYAMMLSKTLIATVLREYDILPAPGGPATIQDIPTTGGMTLAVRGNARVVVRRRGLS